MQSLIRQHFQIISINSYLLIALFIAGAYLVAFPPIFLFAVTIISLPIILFFYDDKNKVSHFIMSLPISKKTIIQSRYLFVSLMTALVLIFQWLIMITFSSWAVGLRYIYDWRDLIILFCMACLIIAVCIPIYYAIRSFTVATGLIAILWILGSFLIMFPIIDVLGMEDEIIFNDIDPGFILLVEKYIPIQSYLILIIISLLLFYISMKVSEQLLLRTDR